MAVRMLTGLPKWISLLLGVSALLMLDACAVRMNSTSSSTSGAGPSLSLSPSSGTVGTLVTFSGTDFTTVSAVSMSGVSMIPITSSSTSLVAMVMPGTVSGSASVTTSKGVFSSGSFTVNSASLPSTQQGSKLVGTGSAGGGVYQGSSLALSADGNTAAMSGPPDNGGIGAVWVFTRTAGVWSQQGSKLVGTGAIGSSEIQGHSIALSADGNTLAVGGPLDDWVNNTGAVWIFSRNAGVWSQQGAKLVGTGGVGSMNQGYSVALSADGNTLALGGTADNSGVGAVWVFTRTAGVWSQQGSKLVGTGAVGASGQGNSLAISADGKTILVGGQYDNSNLGAAWVFNLSGGVWSQQGAKLLASDSLGAGVQQGESVALSADGNTALVGGVWDANIVGAAWVYTRSGGVWTQQGGKLLASDEAVDPGFPCFGNSVALSADGNTAIIGGQDDNTKAGAAWEFSRSGGVWTQQGSKWTGSGAVGAANQGYAVAVSADGSTAIFGGPGDNSSLGAAWVFVP